MADRREDVERVLNPELKREDIAPQAREPKGEHAGAGFGSYYPGPLKQREDAPLLGQPDPTLDDEQKENLQVPREAVMSGTEDAWPSAEARDFRSD